MGGTPSASPTTPNQGYTGAANPSAGPASTPDAGPSGIMSSMGYAPGSTSIKPSTPAASPTPISTTVQPQSQQTPNVGQAQPPCPFYNAMQGLCNDGQNRTSNGGSGGIA